jgi:hypothetical protein
MVQPACQEFPFPASKVNVYSIAQQLSSSSLNSLLHDVSTLPSYGQYLEHKFYWSPQTHRLIVWPVFHRALLNCQTNLMHMQLVKYIYGWLPTTGHEVHHHNPLEDHCCPHCHTIHKRNQHLLRCPHPIRAAQRTQFMTITLHKLLPPQQYSATTPVPHHL